MPLTFDMPFETLKEYQGINPKPADFDAYWDSALAEMRAVDSQVEIVPDEEFQTLSDCLRVWQMDQATDAYAELKEFFRHHDPQHKREAEIFERLGYIDIQHLMPRVKAEILMGTGLMDTLCPPSTQFAAHNKITSKKSLEGYPDFGHENLPVYVQLVREKLWKQSKQS